MFKIRVLAPVLALVAFPGAAQAGEFKVSITVDAAQERGALAPAWRFFGYDEPNYTYMKDGKVLLSKLGALSPRTVFVRTHNLLTSGDGAPALKWGSTNAYTEDAQGRPHYDWKIVDRIFGAYLERGLKPYVQIGFMPRALSVKPEPYQHHWSPRGGELFTGWSYPPKDFGKWEELVYQWASHCKSRYGQAEAESWYWEVWNEPNILYWRGTPDDYDRLYDHAANAVKRALPAARVGGPEVASTRTPEAAKFLRGFLEHCLRGTNHATGRVGAPLDFISFHAKGSPRFVQGHVETGIATQLQDIDRGFEVVTSFPELKNKPIVIGESDPDGCAACPATVFPQNGYRDGALYASYTAAAYCRTLDLARQHKVNLEGSLTWAFEFEDQPYFAGFRVLSTNGIDLPVLNVFRMLGLMSGRRVALTSTADRGADALRLHGVRQAPDVSALASLDARSLSILVWHYHDVDLPGDPAAVELNVRDLPVHDSAVLIEHFRIDTDHSNAFSRWKKMGAPGRPTAQQIVALQSAGTLQAMESPRWRRSRGDSLRLAFSLPRQAVSLLVLRW
ncbi:MAG: GH39 family glycosyl hydrolase [Isosphaeraceae bacterium]